jgi:hypothetical protein
MQKVMIRILLLTIFVCCQNLRKSERRIKELTYQQDEDRKNHERMQVSCTSSASGEENLKLKIHRSVTVAPLAEKSMTAY